jgi:hypothetical protein
LALDDRKQIGFRRHYEVFVGKNITNNASIT